MDEHLLCSPHRNGRWFEDRFERIVYLPLIDCRRRLAAAAVAAAGPSVAAAAAALVGLAAGAVASAAGAGLAALI